MFWELRLESTEDIDPKDMKPCGRFVIHRHYDGQGPHLDVRIEMDGYLMGWRVDGLELSGEPWAAEKAPHPLRWLTHDGDAIREDEGDYAWLERNGDCRRIALRGRGGVRVLRLDRVWHVEPSMVRALMGAVRDHDITPENVKRLIADGCSARQRAISRFCGLARELDGNAFDEKVWRRALNGMCLDEIHVQLRALETRFDQKYPPVPVSQPERLPEEEGEGRGDALAILRDEPVTQSPAPH